MRAFDFPVAERICDDLGLLRRAVAQHSTVELNDHRGVERGTGLAGNAKGRYEVRNRARIKVASRKLALVRKVVEETARGSVWCVSDQVSSCLACSSYIRVSYTGPGIRCQ